MQEFLAGGEVLVLFGKTVSVNQLIAAVVAVLAVLCVSAMFKKAVRIVMILAVVAVCAVYLGFASKEDVLDIASQLKDKGIEAYQGFAEQSKNIKIENGDVRVCLDGNWYSLSDISWVSDGDREMEVTVNGYTYKVTDSTIISMLEQFE